MELSTCKPIGMGGAGPIPWTAIREYARDHGIRDVEQFAELVRTLDASFVKDTDG